jgi:acetyltransferase-like isoleucine patch superfamily enzyme
MIRTILKIQKDLIKKFSKMYELRKYNDFTISEYFRKQGAKIGEDNRIMIRYLGTEPYLIEIGSHCSISSGVMLVTHDGGGWVFTEEIPSLQKFGKITIKDNCYIGINCIIMPNVTIGPNVVIGAGSIVTKDVPPDTVVAGNPARKIRTVEEYKEKVLQTWRLQRPEGYFRGLQEGIKYPPEHIQGIKNRENNILREHLERLFYRLQD